MTMEERIKSEALRPLAEVFERLTRQIDSGEYEIPQTVDEMETITERYIDLIWKRVDTAHRAEQVAVLERVEREVIGEDEAFNAGNSRYVDDRNELRAEQRTALATMKAEVLGNSEELDTKEGK